MSSLISGCDSTMPEVCVKHMRNVIAALAPTFHSGSHWPTGSSSVSTPSSTSAISTAADSVLVADAIGTTVGSVNWPTACA